MIHKIDMVKKYIYYNMNRTELPFYPDRIYLELTNNCNFQCIMCPNGKGLMTREKGFMDYELAKKIIDEMAPHARTIVLHIWGESLLHPRIFDIIKYCQKYNIRTELSTNTSLLNENINRNIIDSGLSMIYLCIDGVTKETYEHVRKNGDYEKSVKNVEDFLKIKNEKNNKKPFVNLQIIVMNETSNEIEAFKNRWSIKGVNKINIKPLDTWGGQIPEINTLRTNGNNGTINGNNGTINSNNGTINGNNGTINGNNGTINGNNKSIKRFHCPNLWYHAHIYWDGTLICCDRDFDGKNPLDNVREGVMKVWNGPKMRELRKKHITQNLDDVPCGNCREWQWWKPSLFSSWGNIPRE